MSLCSAIDATESSSKNLRFCWRVNIGIYRCISIVSNWLIIGTKLMDDIRGKTNLLFGSSGLEFQLLVAFQNGLALVLRKVIVTVRIL